MSKHTLHRDAIQMITPPAGVSPSFALELLRLDSDLTLWISQIKPMTEIFKGLYSRKFCDFIEDQIMIETNFSELAEVMGVEKNLVTFHLSTFFHCNIIVQITEWPKGDAPIKMIMNPGWKEVFVSESDEKRLQKLV